MQRFRRCADWLAGAVVRVLELGMQVRDVCDEVSERACRVVPRSHRVARSLQHTRYMEKKHVLLKPEIVFGIETEKREMAKRRDLSRNYNTNTHTEL